MWTLKRTKHIDGDFTHFKNWKAKLYYRFNYKISKTVEYPNVYTKEEREVVYGYGYHERIYNDKEYVKLLTSVGFVVRGL